MKILLTGGAGFIGSHLTEAFLEKGHKVVVVDLSYGRSNQFNKKTKFYKVDICDSDSLKKVFAKEKPEVVNHHAAEAAVTASGIKLFKINVLGTLNLLNLGKKYKIKKFIFASSAAVYGKAKKFPTTEKETLRPISEYGISKLTAEFYIKIFGDFFKTIIFRYANVYGPRQNSAGEGGVVAVFIKRMLKSKECFIYGDGEQIRDFIFVDDVVQANLKALQFNKSGTFNISTTRQTNIIQLFELIKKITGKDPSFKFKKERAGEIKRSVLDNLLAKKILSWQPRVKLEEGLKKTVEYYKYFKYPVI